MRTVGWQLIRAFGEPLSGLAAAALRLTARRVGVAVVYHAITDETQHGEREIVPPHPPRLFEAQLRHLGRWYRIVGATELLDAVAARRRGERFPVAITFDDDLREHVEVTLPILRRRGATATFFLCGVALERPRAFWWQRLQRALDAGLQEVEGLVAARSSPPLEQGSSPRRLALAVELMAPDDRDAVAGELEQLLGPDPADAGLRAADVRSLVDAGMAIGFHTLRHDPLTLLSDERLADALRSGRTRLEDVVGHGLDAIAYPHGRADGR
ncbi:MAG TPA: polysaccharide deacetylase family protein, partial [Gaiellaceae bacterium]|nr:polysaccharide deacetylase family protein [Gaiellaceae bacterium]